MSLRSLPSIMLVTVALLGAPAAATAVTISSMSDSSAASSAEAVSPAVWAWAATGLIGLGAMVTFGATVVRRGEKRPATAEIAREAATPTYA